MQNSKLDKNSQQLVNETMDTLKKLMRQQNELESKIAEEKQKLYNLVGLDTMVDSEKIETDRWSVMFTIRKEGLQFDKDKFKKENEALYEQYKTKKTAGSRYVDLSKSKEI